MLKSHIVRPLSFISGAFHHGGRSAVRPGIVGKRPGNGAHRRCKTDRGLQYPLQGPSLEQTDREYRKKKDGLTASDHAPVIADLD